jgi:hypothetical protein
VLGKLPVADFVNDAVHYDKRAQGACDKNGELADIGIGYQTKVLDQRPKTKDSPLFDLGVRQTIRKTCP